MVVQNVSTMENREVVVSAKRGRGKENNKRYKSTCMPAWKVVR